MFSELHSFLTSVDFFALHTLRAVSTSADMCVCVWDLQTGALLEKCDIFDQHTKDEPSSQPLQLRDQVQEEHGHAKQEHVDEQKNDQEEREIDVEAASSQLNTTGPVPLRIRAARGSGLCAVICKGYVKDVDCTTL
jgi:hypothetical protein